MPARGISVTRSRALLLMNSVSENAPVKIGEKAMTIAAAIRSRDTCPGLKRMEEQRVRPDRINDQGINRWIGDDNGPLHRCAPGDLIEIDGFLVGYDNRVG